MLQTKKALGEKTSIPFKGMIGNYDIKIAESNQHDQFDVK